jgi:hypothetical protein
MYNSKGKAHLLEFNPVFPTWMVLFSEKTCNANGLNIHKKKIKKKPGQIGATTNAKI